MKKIVISSLMIILAFAIFSINKKNDLKSIDNCPISTNYNGSIKPIKVVQCANMTCHNSDACTKVSSDIAMLTRNSSLIEP